MWRCGEDEGECGLWSVGRMGVRMRASVGPKDGPRMECGEDGGECGVLGE